jgi:hypothetical protein
LSQSERSPECMSGTVVPKEVRVGGVDKRELVRGLREHDVRLNEAAEALFEDRRFVPLGRRAVVEIAFVSVGDLGLPDGATYEQLVRRALKSGLVESPLELGAELRMRFRNQPEGSAGFPAREHRAPHGSVTVASSPLDGSDETPKGFYLRRIEGVLWLRGYRSWPGHIWASEDVFVFSRRGCGSAA